MNTKRPSRSGRVPPWSHVLITGASSGIGRAVALACAGPGTVLHLGGRDSARLEETASTCRVRGADVRTAQVEVSDRAAMRAWIEQAGRLDLVLASAGISGGPTRPAPDRAAQETPEEIERILSVNLHGVVNTVLPAIDAMLAQPRGPDGTRGRIVAIASIAGLAGLPTAPTYCASKAAVDRWMGGTGANMSRDGILLSSVVCGFVRSPMTADNPFPMPGIMDAERAAALILRGAAQGRRRIVFPRWLAAATRALDLLPAPLTDSILLRQKPKQRLAG